MRARAIEYVEEASLAIRHLQRALHEGHGHPHALARMLRRLTDAAKCRLAIYQWPHEVPCA
jgi:hypothetical protein